jgi:uncharacterized protein with PIN domain
MDRRPRFLADEMLGSLARWLRIMGYDTAYARDRGDTEILAQARDEDRMLLTRDRQLAERAGERGLLVESADLERQLRQVIEAYGLVLDEPMTRCTLCNGVLVRISPEEAADLVPPRVREAWDEFYRCTKCGQVYWKGTHWKRIGERLDRAREPKDDNSPR